MIKTTKDIFRIKRIILLAAVFISVTIFNIHLSIAGDWIKPGEERFRLNAGAFLAFFNTDLTVDSKTLGAGTGINLEDDLDLDENTATYLINGYWRFAHRHRLYAGYYTFNREAGGELNKDLQVGDEIFPAGAGYYSEFDYNVVPISYGYSFINTEKHELAGIIGLHWSTIDFNITGYASAGSAVVTGDTSAKASAPLPLIGIGYEYRFTDRWTAGVMAQAFYLKLSDDALDFSGSVLTNCAVKG